MTADALVPCVATSSEAVELIMYGKLVFVFHLQGFQLITPSQ